MSTEESFKKDGLKAESTEMNARMQPTVGWPAEYIFCSRFR